MSRKAKVTVSIYYTFPPKGKETSPNQITWEDDQKYRSGKPLRRGPDRPPRKEKDKPPRGEKRDPNPDGDKPSDSGMP